MTEAEIRRWLLKRTPRVIVVEVDYMYQVGVGDSAVPTLGTLYLSNRPYTDPATPTRKYVDCLRGIPTFTRSLDRDTLIGKYDATVGTCVMDNTDGRISYLLGLALDGSEDRIKIGDPSWNYSDFVRLYSAMGVRVGAPAPGDELELEMKDASLLINRNIGGTVTVGGTGPSANQYRPLNFGYVHQVTPIPVDSALLIYAHSDTGTNTTAQAVRDNAVDVSFTDNGDGTFTLAASPAGQITCDVLAASGTAYRFSAGFNFLIGDRGGLTALGRYFGPRGSTAGTVGGFNDYHMGISISEKRNIIDVLDDMCNSDNLFWAFDRDGNFYYDTMRPDALASVIAGSDIEIAAEITRDDVDDKSLELTHRVPTYDSYQGYGNFNWSTQSTFASSLTPAERDQYARIGYLTEDFFGEEPSSTQYLGSVSPWLGGAPQLYHKSLSSSQLIATLISGPDDTTAIEVVAGLPTQAVANYLQEWASVRRSQFLPWTEFLDITVGLKFYTLELGDIVNITYPGYDMEGGVLMQVCSINIDVFNEKVQLGLVRRRFGQFSGPPPSFELREDGGYELREDDGKELRE